ncbi:MAG TPA: hypothetical protein VFP55_10210 [Solirubrobacteraceae bacterium]|nr:hypothetical protein [Solirubrobacteraceae bacterium]
MQRQTVSGWAGVALTVVLGLAATVVLAGCGGSSHGHRARTASTPTASTPLTVSTSTKPGRTTSPGGTPTVGNGSLAPGGPVPPGVEASSVTFISPSTAFILGTAPCDARPCSAILRTTDRGVSWVGLPAPRKGVSYPLGNGLWGLRFADSQHGYAFGQGLWETANSGRSWQRATAPAPTVLSLEAVQDREIVALARSCQPGQGCGRAIGLYHEPIGGTWQRVASVGSGASGASISVLGEEVWAIAGNRLFYSADSGRSFAPQRQPCPTHGSNFGQPTSITNDGSHVYVLCTGQGFTGNTLKYVYASTGAGAPWTLVGKPPSPGDGGQISAGSDDAILIASYSAASFLYRSDDGGQTWSTVLTKDDGGAGWSDLGFTTSTDAVVVHGPAIQDGAGDQRPGKVLLSEDGGLTWHAASF